MKTVVGIFKTRQEATKAANLLRVAGFEGNNVIILSPGTPDADVEAAVPTEDAEQPGMGKAIGSVVGRVDAATRILFGEHDGIGKAVGYGGQGVLAVTEPVAVLIDGSMQEVGVREHLSVVGRVCATIRATTEPREDAGHPRGDLVWRIVRQESP